MSEMVNGAHAIIFSSDADADRAFFKDVLGLRFVDAGGGRLNWVILTAPRGAAEDARQ
jgi:catechol 2,3-dioxygenase-like lactoylglutathione lyase family enzyme